MDWSGPEVNHKTIIQGQDAAGSGYRFNDFYGWDMTDAWTQLFCLGGLMFGYGFFLLYYVHTHKFKDVKRKPKSRAWKAWDSNEVSYRLPYVVACSDFLGWHKSDHFEDFDGKLFLYSMPKSGPWANHNTYLKKRIFRRVIFSDLPIRCIFFPPKRHLEADRLTEVPKKFPFTELTEVMQSIDLNTLDMVEVGLPKLKNGKITLKVNVNFDTDAEFEQCVEELYEKIKPNLADLNKIAANQMTKAEFMQVESKGAAHPANKI